MHELRYVIIYLIVSFLSSFVYMKRSNRLYGQSIRLFV